MSLFVFGLAADHASCPFSPTLHSQRLQRSMAPVALISDLCGSVALLL